MLFASFCCCWCPRHQLFCCFFWLKPIEKLKPHKKLWKRIKAVQKLRSPRQADRSEYPAEATVCELCGGVATNSRNYRLIENISLHCPIRTRSNSSLTKGCPCIIAS